MRKAGARQPDTGDEIAVMLPLKRPATEVGEVGGFGKIGSLFDRPLIALPRL